MGGGVSTPVVADGEEELLTEDQEAVKLFTQYTDSLHTKDTLSDADKAAVFDKMAATLQSFEVDVQAKHKASVRMQATMRGKTARKEVQAKKDELEVKEQTQAAVLMQSTMRGKSARKEVEAKKEVKEQEKAAVLMQSTMRGKSARKEVEAKKATLRNAEETN